MPGPRGLTGRDGKTGPQGVAGMKGDLGPPAPKTGGVTYVRWGRTTCPDTEGTELVYVGRAAGSYYSHQGHRSTFECVDASAETIIGGGASLNGAFFYHVEPRCGSLPCPPYEPQKEMTCAVCTH